MKKLFAIMLLLVVIGTIGGCNRQTQLQKQSQADAHAGVEAMRSLVTGFEQRIAQLIASGLHANIEASTKTPRQELPPPEKTPDQIISQPVEYEKKAVERRDEVMSGSAWAWLGGGLLAVLGAARFIPGTPGMISNLAHSWLSSNSDRKTKQRAEFLSEAGQLLIEQIEKQPEGSTIADLKDKLARVMPDNVKQVVREITS